MDAVSITVGTCLIVLSLIIWYLATWIKIEKESENVYGGLGVLGYVINIFGFTQMINFSILGTWQTFFMAMVHFVYVFMVLYAMDCLRKSWYIKENKQ